MELEKNLQKCIDLYLNHFGIIFLASLVVILISCLSFGFLAGPLFGGLILLNLNLLRGKTAEFKEIFNHFNKFIPTLIVCLVSEIILLIISNTPTLGLILGIILSPFILIISSIAITLIIEKNFKPLQAVKAGIAFFKTQPIIIWIYGLIILIISGIGTIVFGFGGFLTFPFAAIGMAVAYREFTDKSFFEVSGSRP